jgi:serine/threonine-protein kinase
MQAGTRLGHYEILSAIGKGGMGEVYQARDTKLGRDVAVKLLPEIFVSDADRVSRLEREARLLAVLNHPNIAAVFGFERFNDAHFIVLELVEGQTLAEILHRGPPPPAEALRIARQIVDALEAAHDKGVIHRDLKPANIKITDEGKVKVLDFGLAKALANEQANAQISQSPTLSLAATNAGLILGTAAYMSPEQAKGSAKVDNRSDIFSFGCVLWEMLTGHQTFNADTIPEILASVLARDPDFSRLPGSLNPKIHDIVRRCLEKDVRKRWQAVGDIRVELDAIGSDPKQIERIAVPSANSLSMWKAAGLIFAGVILGLAVAGSAWWATRPSGSPAITRFPIFLPEGVYFSRTRSQVAAISPDGSNLAYVANRQLYLRRLSDIEATPIRGTDQDVSSPFFSPDGKWIAFNSFQDGALKKIAVTGGAPVTVVPSITTLAFGMHWQDHTIVFAQAGREILAVPDNGGTPEVWVKAEPNEVVSSPFLLPGGDILLYSRMKAESTWDKADIMVWSRKAGPPKVLLSGGSGARWAPTGHIVYVLRGDVLAAPFDTQTLQAGSPVVVVENTATGVPFSSGPAHFDFSQNGTFIYVPGLPGILDQNVLRTPVLVDRSGRTTPIPNLRPGAYAYPRVSSDGKWAVVDMLDDGSIQILDLSGRVQPRRLTLVGSNTSPIWSPDNQRIAYRSSREGKIGIMMQNVNGSGAAEWLMESPSRLYTYPFAWSGDQIMFLAGEADTGLSTLSTVDNKVEVFDNAPNFQANASFSRDGRWVAYQSLEGGNGYIHIYVRQFPKGDKFQITSGKTSYIAPVWSPLGDELFYYNVESRRVQFARIQTQPNFTVIGEPKVLPLDRLFQESTSLRAYDIMPDGKTLLMMQPATPSEPRSPAQLHVILNWFEELKEKVPRH